MFIDRKGRSKIKKPWSHHALILVSELATLAAILSGIYIWSRDLDESSARNQVIRTAESMLGKPYIWGGTNPSRGFDCSGLVKYSHQKTSIKLPRTSLKQYRSSKKITKKELQPGDLVFFRTRANRVSHVGIYVGKQQFIHAPRAGKNVQVSSLDSDYWKHHYAGAGNFYTSITQ